MGLHTCVRERIHECIRYVTGAGHPSRPSVEDVVESALSTALDPVALIWSSNATKAGPEPRLRALLPCRPLGPDELAQPEYVKLSPLEPPKMPVAMTIALSPSDEAM